MTVILTDVRRYYLGLVFCKTIIKSALNYPSLADTVSDELGLQTKIAPIKAGAPPFKAVKLFK